MLFEKISKFFGGKLAGRTIAVWGLAFKPNTDDMREAPARVLIEALWAAGAKVRAYDPVAMPEARRIYGARPDFALRGERGARRSTAPTRSRSAPNGRNSGAPTSGASRPR